MSRAGFARTIVQALVLCLACGVVAGVHAVSRLSPINSFEEQAEPVEIAPRPMGDTAVGAGDQTIPPDDSAGSADTADGDAADDGADPAAPTIVQPAPDPVAVAVDVPAQASDLLSGPVDCFAAVEREVGLEVAARLWRCANREFQVMAHFLDARTREDFDAGRVDNAIWMPQSRIIQANGLSALDGLGVLPDDPIVIYCTGGDCDASKNTAGELQAAGFTNLIIMKAGYDEWAAAGLPTSGG